MISLKYTSIPSFLHSSAFHSTLSDDPLEGDISIPKDCFKADDNVTTVAELEQILHVDRFWGLNPLPFSMLDYCCKMEKSRQRRTEMLELSNKFPTLLEIRTIFSDEAPLLKALQNEARPEVIDYLIRTTVDTKGTASSTAARFGLLPHLKSLYINGHHWNEATCSAAAYGGHLDCLIYAHENGCPWDHRTYESAAVGGHIACIQYAHKNGLAWDSETARVAALYNQLACLKYMLGNGCPLNVGITYEAAKHGYNECLEYALEMGCPIYPTACLNAVRGDYFQCLQLLHQYGAEWDEEVTCAAAGHGNLVCLQYLHENGCPWDEQTTDYAVQGGHLDCLQYAIEQNCPYTDNLLIDAVESAPCPVVQYLVETVGLRPSDPCVFLTAIKRCNYECLRYIIDQKFPFGDFTEDDLCEEIRCFGNTEYGEQDMQLFESIKYALLHGWQVNEWFVKYVDVHQDDFPISFRFVEKLHFR